MNRRSEIRKLNTCLKDVCARLYPALQIVPRLRPLLELERGDFFSDAALLIGAALKLEPQNIAEQVVKALSDAQALRAVAEIEAQRGFINVRLRNLDSAPTVLDASDRMPLRIAAYWPAHAVYPERLRVLAQAYFCAHIAVALSVETTIALPGGGTVSPTTRGDCLGSFRTQLRVSELWSNFESCSFSAQPGLRTLRFGMEGETPPSVAECWTVLISRRKLKLIEWPISAAELADWSDEVLCDALWYLAGETEGDGLDPEVPRLHEHANLGWFLRYSARRLAHIIPSSALPSVAIENPNLLPAHERALRVRTQQMPLWLSDYICSGQARGLTLGLTDFLHRVNAPLNDPQQRATLEPKSPPTPMHHALAGASDALRELARILEMPF